MNRITSTAILITLGTALAAHTLAAAPAHAASTLLPPPPTTNLNLDDITALAGGL